VTEPLVAVICRAPILSVAVADALDGVATVKCFPARHGDTEGLLRGLDPDAVVVDCDDDARAAAAFAADSDSPVVHLSLRRATMSVLEDGAWRESDEGATPSAIRNAIVKQVYGRRAS
jgi:hypothetical protein